MRRNLNKNFTFFMALAPISITRSVLVLNEKNSKVFVSTTFIAKFEDKSEKFLNKKQWINKSLFNKSDEGNTPLFMDNCTLFFKDWSKNPMFGDFDKDYPCSLLPKELLLK